MQTGTEVQTRIVPRADFQPDRWLWCLHCGRFFQGRSARPDAIGRREGCAFTDCDGSGYGTDVFDWNAWATDDPAIAARWPREDELYEGRVARPWLDADEDVEAVFGAGATRVPLALVPPADHGEPRISHFRDLAGDRLAVLIEGGAIAPCIARCVAAPGLERVRAFLAAWPEVRAHGHVRHDGAANALAIEGLECDLLEATEARRDAVRWAFRDAFADAPEYFNEPDWLYAWWD